MQRINDEEHRKYRRSALLWNLTYLVLIVLACGTAWVQLHPDERIIQQSQKQYWANVTVSATRGSIFDRNGSPLAVSVPSESFFIDPKFWNPEDNKKLIPFFGKKTAEKFSRPMKGRFHWVARNVPEDNAILINAEKIDGLFSKKEYIRTYPRGAMAFHVLGFCNIDDYGQAGIELAWNHILFSPPRVRMMTRNSHGSILDPLSGKARTGNDTAGSIRLTLDSRIQQIMENRLGEAAQKASAKWAAGVCVNPKTGEVLALASYPTVDSNDRKTLKGGEQLRNNVIGRVYEPGSIFKPISMSLALETGAASPGSRYYCSGAIQVADKVIREANNRSHGAENLTQVLMNSCNVGMSVMSKGVDRNEAYGLLKQLGFGEKTGIELAGEEAGLVKPPEQWLGTVTANVFIGQGIAVTPLQEVMAISCIANGGKLMKPYIVDQVFDSSGKIIHIGAPRVRGQVMSPKTAEFLRRAMFMVVSEGGGKHAKSDKVHVAGKTGTAQVAGTSGKYQEGKYNASFVGFWPAENPKYVMLITIGEPKGLYYGGVITAPVFKQIVDDIVDKGQQERTSN